MSKSLSFQELPLGFDVRVQCLLPRGRLSWILEAESQIVGSNKYN